MQKYSRSGVVKSMFSCLPTTGPTWTGNRHSHRHGQVPMIPTYFGVPFVSLILSTSFSRSPFLIHLTMIWTISRLVRFAKIRKKRTATSEKRLPPNPFWPSYSTKLQTSIQSPTANTDIRIFIYASSWNVLIFFHFHRIWMGNFIS